MLNISLIKKLEELERTEEMYRGLVDHTRYLSYFHSILADLLYLFILLFRRVLMGYFDLVRVMKEVF